MGRRPLARTVNTLRTTIMELENAPDHAPEAAVTELKRVLISRFAALDAGPETPDETPNQIVSAPDNV